jgi:hypothetical protein
VNCPTLGMGRSDYLRGSCGTSASRSSKLATGLSSMGKLIERLPWQKACRETSVKLSRMRRVVGVALARHSGRTAVIWRPCCLIAEPTCHCATTPAHSARALAATRDARRRCQVVRLADVEAVRRRVARYKSFQQTLRDLEGIGRAQRAFLRGPMEGRSVSCD